MVANATQHQSNIARVLIAVVILWTLLGGVSVANGFDVGHVQMQQSTMNGHDQGHMTTCEGSNQCDTPSVVDCLAHCMTVAPTAHTDALMVSFGIVLIVVMGGVVQSMNTTQRRAPSTTYSRPLYQFATIHLKE